MPGDVTSPYGFVLAYGSQLIGGLRRAFGRGNPRTVEPIARDGTVPASRRPAPPEPPAVPDPVPAPGGVSPYVTRPINEPKRQSGRKAKRRRRADIDREIVQRLGDQGIWPYSVFSDKFSTADKIRQSVAMGGLQTAIGRGVQVNLPKGMQRPPTPGTGTRSSQRGFVAPELVPLIAEPPMPTPGTTRAPSRRPARVPSRPPARFMPGVGSPAAEPPPTGPDVRVQEYTDADIQRALERIPAAQPVYPGSGPATSTSGATRSSGPAGTPTAKPGKTGSRTPVALPTLGKIVVSPDALLTYAVGTLPRRSSPAGQISPGLSPATARTRATAPTALATLMQPQRINDPNCDCKKEKAKDRQPRAPRTVCWRGTYVETAKGLTKKRISLVNC